MLKRKNKRIFCTVINDLVYDQRMIRICTSMQNAGFEVTLVGREKKESKPIVKQIFKQVRLKIKKEKGKAFYLQYHFALKAWLEKQEIDILYAVDLDTLTACGQVSKKQNIIMVYDAHEYFTELPELRGRPMTKMVWAAIAKKYIPQASLCITVSDVLGDVFSRKYKKKFHVIRNLPIPKPSLKPTNIKQKIILYQGVLNEGRGIEALIDAMLQINDAILWLVGMGDLESKFKALVIKKRLEEKVIFKGHIKPHELHKITSECWLGVNLLEGDSLNYYYSLANKFFDYMMAGIPSLNMNFPAYRSILNEYSMGLLLTELSPDSIANEINKLLDDSNKYSKLCDHALAAQSVFNWSVEEVKLIDLLKGL